MKTFAVSTTLGASGKGSFAAEIPPNANTANTDIMMDFIIASPRTHTAREAPVGWLRPRLIPRDLSYVEITSVNVRLTIARW